MKYVSPEDRARLDAELHEARAFLDQVIATAHAQGALGVAVRCFLAQANLTEAIELLEEQRLERVLRERLLTEPAPHLQPGEHDAFPRGRLAELRN